MKKNILSIGVLMVILSVYNNKFSIAPNNSNINNSGKNNSHNKEVELDISDNIEYNENTGNCIIKGEIRWNILNTFLNKLSTKNKLNIVFNKDVEIDPQELSKFYQELKKKKIKSTVNLNKLSYNNSSHIFVCTIDFLEIFSIIEFGLSNDEINELINSKITDLSLIQESSKKIIKNNKTIESITLVNDNKNLKIVLTRQLESISREIPDFFQEFFDIESQMTRSPSQKAKNPIIDRAKILLDSNEVDSDIKNRIKILLDKIESRGSNPNNESEKVKQMDMLKTITDIVILKKEDAANSKNIINIIANLLKEKKQNEFINFIKKIQNNLWNYLEPSESAKEIERALMEFVENLAMRKINNNPNKPRLAMLLHGEPGLGKTSVPKQFAEINGIPVTILNAGDEKKFFVGGLSIYANSDAGAIAKGLQSKAGGTLIKENKASKTMIFILDEVDKYSKETQESLLPLLDSAQKFIDQNLECPLPIEDCIFILTANDISKVSEPLKDRCSKVIRVKHLSFANKKNIVKNFLINNLKKMYPEKTIDVNNDALDLIVNKSGGLGARQIKNNTQNLINYITNHMVVGNTNKIEIKKNIVQEALSSNEAYISPINSYESKVGYINGVVNSKTTEGYNEKCLHKVSNILVFATNEFNGQHTMIPIDYNFQSFLQGLSKSVVPLLNNRKLSNKNVYVNIKETNLSITENRSLAALILIGWVSAVSGQKIKQQSTIIADVLPNNDLEYDPSTINKIQLVYNYGIRYIVIAKSKNNSQEDGDEEPPEFKNLKKIFNLKLKKKTENSEIYYHDYENTKQDSMYPGLEICIVENINDGLNYLLVS
jgi:ATP-dependent Lon protease